MIEKTPINLERFLERLTSRSMLSSREQSAILELPGQVVEVEPNRDFAQCGHGVDHAYLIVEGLAGRFGQTLNGQRQITAFHIPGDMPGLPAVALPKANLPLQALSAVIAVRIPCASIRAIAAEFPAIAEALWRDSLVDASISAQWVVNIGRRDAMSRVAHLLCEMAIRYKRGNADVAFELHITQVHLADATGLTAVHVNRTLKALRTAGVIAVGVRSIMILDWNALAALGEFDASYLHESRGPDNRIRILQAA